MTSLRRVAVTLIFALSAVAVFAQSPPQRDPQAMAILTQSYAVLAAAAGGVQDSLSEGTITWQGGRSGTIVLKTKGNYRLRNETTFDGAQTIYIINNRRGQIGSQGTTRRAPLWVTAYQRPEHIAALSRLGDFLRPNMNVTLVGTVDVNGRAAYQIRFFASPTDATPPEIEEIISDFHVFLDVQTLLVTKTISYDFSPEIIENRTQVETYYADYQSVSGVPVPRRITRYIRGQQQREIILTSIRFNVGLPDSDFQIAPVSGRAQ